MVSHREEKAEKYDKVTEVKSECKSQRHAWKVNSSIEESGMHLN